MVSTEIPQVYRLIYCCNLGEARSRMAEVITVENARKMKIKGLQVLSVGIKAVSGNKMNDSIHYALTGRGYHPEDFAGVRPDGSWGARRISDLQRGNSLVTGSLVLCYSSKDMKSVESRSRAYSLSAARVELIHEYAQTGVEIKDPAKQLRNNPCFDFIPYGIAEKLGLIYIGNIEKVNRYHDRLVLRTEEAVKGVLKKMLEEGLVSSEVV